MKRNNFHIAVAVTTLVTLLPSQSAMTAEPSWWTQRGVIDAGQQKDDYAGVNTGQLKQMAKQALAELNTVLPGGGGAAVESLITSFSVINAERNDFAAINIGQLKSVAKPFYDRLIAVGYASGYPWSDTDPAKDDYAQANIGQMKNVFSFDVGKDTDTDGLPDFYEALKALTSLSSLDSDSDGISDALEDHDGDSLSLREEFLLETNPVTSGTSQGITFLSVHTPLE